MTEEWKDIEGYEGKYQVSNLGRFRGPRGLQSGYKQSSGYIYVTLWKTGSPQKVCRLHRLVATYFCHHPEGCNVIDHIDSNKENNAASNLEWVSSATNMQRAEVKKRIPHVCDFNYKRPVELLKDGERKVFFSVSSAARFIGTSSTEVSKVCKGIYPSIKGWKCKYTTDVDVKFNRQVEAFKDDNHFVFPSAASAARHFGISRSTINRHCSNNHPLPNGWTCKYVFSSPL